MIYECAPIDLGETKSPRGGIFTFGYAVVKKPYLNRRNIDQGFATWHTSGFFNGIPLWFRTVSIMSSYRLH